MKILIVHNSYQIRGGEDAVVDAELELLTNAGHEVVVAREHNDKISSPAQAFSTFINIANNKKWYEKIDHIVRDEKIDVVHIHNFFPIISPSAHRAVAKSSAALVQTLHNFRISCANGLFLREGRICEKCLHGSNFWSVAHGCYRNSSIASLAVSRMQREARSSGTWEGVDRFIALTPFSKSKFVEAGLPADRIVVKPNFVKSQPENGERSLAGDYVLFVGRLSVEKGVETLLEAWRGENFGELVIAGDGPAREHLTALAPERVTFLGAVNQQRVRDLMLGAKFLVFPSIWYEGFPMTLVEALSASLPVIASNIGSMPNILVNGESGLLFEPGNSTSLKIKISELINNPNALKLMSHNARRSYDEKYTAEKNIKILDNIYSEAVENKRLRSL